VATDYDELRTDVKESQENSLEALKTAKAPDAKSVVQELDEAAALDSGTSLHALQDSMGHEDPRTTRRYDRARNNLFKSAGYDVARALA
jgi:hypothetical protein